MMTKDKIVIVDGNSLINRAYFAMAELRNSNGIYTGGIHGLTNMVLSLMDQFSPKYFCVTFDMKGPTFRHQAYEDYKGTRKGMPDELAMQLPIVKEILDVLGIPRMELQGYEADDLIGTIATQFSDAGMEAHIITGDKDALQLASSNIHVHITKKGITSLVEYDEALILSELGVGAKRVIDYKGLCGDSSDNIPGIPGIGPKTAAKLLSEFDTVENLIENYDSISNARISNLVKDYCDQALLSKRLATIFTQVPIEADQTFFELKAPQLDKAVPLFMTYELTQLASRFKAINTPKEVTQVFYKVVTAQAIKDLMLQERAMHLHAITERNQICHMAFGFKKGIFILDDPKDLMVLKDPLENSSIEKIGYDLKSLYLALMAIGIDLNGVVFDGFIGAYLLQPSRKTYTLSEIAFEMTELHIKSEEELLGKGAKKLTFSDLDMDLQNEYIAQYVSAIYAIYPGMMTQLEDKNIKDLFENVEMPLVKILADIEHTGFKVDMTQLDSLDVQLSEKLQEIEADIYSMVGETFNINSPKQLGVILFEKLGLPTDKKTKTGYSTGHDVLERLASKHPIASLIIEYRIYSKLKSTYIDGLRAVIDPQTHRVHTSLNQTVTVTGRLSSTEPNLQNIPIKLPFGRKVRKCFIADDGCELLDADYSQIELRVLAHLSKDPTLLDAFSKQLDIHTITASQVFGIPENEVSSLQRSRAKEVNFGIVYGMGDFGLSESLGISRKEAKAYIENYFKSYPNVQGFMDDIITTCKEKGYVETILKRKRDVPDIDHKNFMLRSAAERIARNTPIQGSAADIIKLAMIDVYRALKTAGLKSKLILQVHDELIINVVPGEMEQVKELLKSCMESAYPLSVPLKVDMQTGVSWYDSK